MQIKLRNLIIIAVIVAVISSVAVHLALSRQSSNMIDLSTGTYAPKLSFTYSNGSNGNVADFSGRTTLLYFVSTWCSSCAEGANLLSQNSQFLSSHNITVVFIEFYNDLGYSGPSISNFVEKYYNKTSAVAVVAGYNMTLTYDPTTQLEEYYLLSPEGKILFAPNEPLVSSFNSLMNFISSNNL